MAIRPDYTAGTVSIAANGTVLTGVGTIWAAAGLKPGATFKTKNLDAIIASVDSNTQVTLTEPWTGGALAGATYAIRYQPDGSSLTAKLQELIEMLGNGNLQALAALAGAFDMIPIFTGPGALTLIAKNDLIEGVQTDAKVANLAGRAAYDASPTGFSVLVNDVGDGRAAIFFKLTSASGDWSTPAYLTGPNGTFQSKGSYSGATTYQIGDVVLQNGSSWIARVITTGNPPPTLPTTSNTQWFLLAAAGNGFTFRGAYSGATPYVKDDVVVDQGSSWIALQATTGNAPPALPTTSNANWQLIAQGAGTFKGAYSGVTAYQAGDVVFDQNSSWVAKIATTGNPPPTLPATSNTQWQAVAVKGTGDTNGPASSIQYNPAKFADPSGKVLKDAGYNFASISGGWRNKIRNGFFDLWEVGVSTTAVGFFADNAWNNDHGLGSKTVSRQAFPIGQTDVPGNPKFFSRNIRVTGNAAGSYGMKRQAIENVFTCSGKKVTVKFYAKADAPKVMAFQLSQYFGTGGSPSALLSVDLRAINLITAWQKFAFTVNVPSVSGKILGTNGNDALLLDFWFDAGSSYTGVTGIVGLQSGTFDISSVELVEGDATDEDGPFEIRTLGIEALINQRYTHWMDSSENAFKNFGMGVFLSTTNAVYQISHPVKLRAPPTFFSGGAASFAGGTLTQDVPGRDMSRLNMSGGLLSGLSGGAAALQANNTTGTFLYFLSEII